ncbi:O-antigen/teichoic acid export membrane protein [Alkalibaculum bacchi]|uniref:O-antigen/teichoic acid export membrane protein n=1 Tax=Alkalibaculum bacchi TaxID=645887 RepID=A0A366IDL6_9FIRM|nr:oligosaccharide flippase family protein [Alkalibaculum bacchi]RBP69084.1 O-antigen/teichoic acid export membrane protein [Alkalibaculum bacchi]
MRLILYIQKKIKKSTFGKNIMLITGGTAFAQALGIIFSPIITRIYPPEQYGVLTAYSAVLGLLAISASFDYQNAIPIADDDDMAINLLVLSMSFLSIVVLIIFVLLTLYGEHFLKLMDSEVLSSYKYLIPFGVFFTGTYNIVLQWGFRERNYKIITRTKISQSITSNLTKLIFGLMKFGPVGLILGVIIGQSAGITSLITPVIKKKELLLAVSQQRLKQVMKRYKNFPLYSAPSNYVYTAGNNLPVVLLVSFFGTSAVGLFGLANSITSLPMSLIGNSVSQVFYSEAAKIGKDNPDKIKSIAQKLIKQIALIALIPFVILLLFGPWLFSFVFGSEWYDAGVYSQMLSFMVYFHFIITPVGRILEIFERQREGLLLNITRLILIFVAFVITKTMNLNSYQAVGLYSIFSSITYVALLVMVMKILDSEIKRVNNQ